MDGKTLSIFLSSSSSTVNLLRRERGEVKRRSDLGACEGRRDGAGWLERGGGEDWRTVTSTGRVCSESSQSVRVCTLKLSVVENKREK